MRVDRSLVAPVGRTCEEGQADGAVWMRISGRPDRSSRRRMTSCTAQRQIECSTGSRAMKAFHGAQPTRARRSIAFDPRGSSGSIGLLAEHRAAGRHVGRTRTSDRGDMETQLVSVSQSSISSQCTRRGEAGRSGPEG